MNILTSRVIFVERSKHMNSNEGRLQSNIFRFHIILEFRFTGHVANPGWGFYGIRKIFLLEPESHVDQTDQNRNL
jgi:hypothetical protein